MIYQPSDDSFLLAEQVKKYAKWKSVLDIGTGSGIQALTAKQAGASSVLATDINQEAVNCCKEQSIKSIKSNLFSNIIKSYDLIIFNPPYLAEDKKEPRDSRKATTGGKKGDEIILKFLKQAKPYLNKNGIILIVLSSLTPMKRILALLSTLGLQYKTISSKNFFMETLYIWEIQ